MNILEKLQKPLEISEIDFMPKTLAGNNALILAYKDARCDMKRLDEATGGLWQNKYERDSKGVLQCGIGIKIDTEWVWKWSNGVPSETEAEKGEYSDAFKRAGFMWGIGRELYEYPIIWATVQPDDIMDYQGKKKLSNRFRPQDWTWKKEENILIAKDKKGIQRVKVQFGEGKNPIEITQEKEITKTELDTQKEQIDSILTLEELRAFYAKNKGKGKAFDLYLMKRADELKNTVSEEQIDELSKSVEL